jgi:hypothetical protein
VKRQVSYQWRLREVMAAHGMFTIEPPPIWRTPPVGGVRVVEGCAAVLEAASVLG